MPTFVRDRINFNYQIVGDEDGLAIVFQHGLGADVSQPLGLFTPPPGLRMICMDARGHGETRPLGDEAKISIASFADDLLALLDHLRIDRAVIGGISMGAAVAINFAIRHRDRVLGLILSRPAWLTDPNPPNTRVFSKIASLIREHGVARAAELFEGTDEYHDALRIAPECAKSLLGQFASPRATDAVARLERIPPDAPVKSASEIASIRVPTLVLANQQDTIHPFDFGVALARLIPGSRFVELTSKSIDKDRHAVQTRQAIGEFLAAKFLSKSPQH